MTDGPVLISRSMVLDALKDETFFRQIPQFATLRPKLQTMGTKLGGCKGCRGDTIAKNILADFLSILSVLDVATITRLKRYLGVAELMYSAHDPRTGAFNTRIV